MRLTYPVLRRNKDTGVIIPLFPTDPTPKLSAYFDNFLKHWETTEACHQLALLLDTTMPPITKIVAFACSNMSSEEGLDSRSASQHALILSLRRLLQTRTIRPIECFAQDPIYTSSDKDVLAEHNIKVLNDPRGFLHVDDSSVVLSVSPNMQVRQIITDIARPALLIWDRVHGVEEERGFG